MSLVEHLPDIFGKEVHSQTERDFYRQAREAYRVWHIREGRNRGVIDFDLHGPSPFIRLLESTVQDLPTRSERGKIVESLSEIFQKAQETRPGNIKDAHSWEFFLAQLEASVAFAKRLNGERSDVSSFIEQTTGIRPEMIPQELLQSQKERALSILRELGVAEPNEKALLGFRFNNQLTPDKAHEWLRRKADEAIRRLQSLLSEKFEVNYNIEDVNVNDYWWVWAMTDPTTSQFSLKQNFNDSQLRVWTSGKTEELGYHEGAEHLARMAKRQALIKSDKLDPFFGLTTVHGPEPIVEEGLAQTLVFFLPGAWENITLEGRFQIVASILRNLTYANVHLMVNNPDGFDPSKVMDYVWQFLPWESKESIEQQITWRTKDPLKQTYLWQYGEGARRHLAFAEQLNRQGKKLFLQNIFARPYTATQEEQLVANLLRDPKNCRVPQKLVS